MDRKQMIRIIMAGMLCLMTVEVALGNTHVTGSNKQLPAANVHADIQTNSKTASNYRYTRNDISDVMVHKQEKDFLSILRYGSKNLHTFVGAMILDEWGHTSNKAFLYKVLAKAGQDNNVDLNYAAAHLLVDMGKYSEAFKILLTMVHRGQIDKRLTTVTNRLPEPKQIRDTIEKENNKHYIQYVTKLGVDMMESEKLTSKVRVFGTLMCLAYFNAETTDAQDNRIKHYLSIAEDEELWVAIGLLKIGVWGYKENVNKPLEIMKVLFKNKNKEIASLAKNIHDKKFYEKRKKRRAYLKLEKGYTPVNWRVMDVTNYLGDFGDTREEVTFLISLLQIEKNTTVRKHIVLAIGYSRHMDVICPVLKRMVMEGQTTPIQEAAREGLLRYGPLK